MSALSREERSSILLQNIGKADCAVIAYQAVTGQPRAEAVEVMTRVAKYNPDTGTFRSGLIEAVRSQGYQVDMVPAEDLQRETPATFSLTHLDGMYLIHVETNKGGHVMALVNGDLHNSRTFWGWPIRAAERVVAP